MASSRLCRLGTETLWLRSMTGFAYPQKATVVDLLGTGTGGGNAVLQQGALTLRQARLSGTTPDVTQYDTLRGWYEDRSQIAFVDFAGASREVVILDFGASHRFAGVYDYDLVLLEV